MKFFATIVTLLCMLLYGSFGVWLITRFRSPLTGIFGTLTLIVGGNCLYRLAPHIVAALPWIVAVAAVLAVLAFVFIPFERLF